jgi:hypothetical protein
LSFSLPLVAELPCDFRSLNHSRAPVSPVPVFLATSAIVI